MRTVSIVAALGVAVVACKDKDKGGAAKQDDVPASREATALPQVAEAATMIPEGAPPEMVVIADADGRLWINAAPSSWAKLATTDLRRGAKQVDARTAHYAINQGRALGTDGERFMKDWSDGPSDMMLPPDDSLDDPPPPEPEDEEEDDEDESGGTGTAMALEEGKMGKKDSVRVEGQYKMKRYEDPEEVAARKRGSCGAFASLVNDDPGATVPARQCAVAGEVITDGDVAGRNRSGDAYSILLAAPTAKAAPLIDVLEETELIGASVGDKIRALRVAFVHPRDGFYGTGDPSEDRWIEVRIWPAGLDIEAVPDVAKSVPWVTGPLDGKAVAAAYEQALAARELDKDYPVDVLVSPEVDMEHLVAVLAALDQAGAKVIGLGLVPAKGERQAGLRGKRIPRLEQKVGGIIGDIDRKAVTDTIAAERGKIVACYETLLATKPDAEGTIEVAFTIDKKGTVAKPVVEAFDPELATCVSGVFARVKFPAPASGTAQGNALYGLSN
jgi:hypothetical protein